MLITNTSGRKLFIPAVLKVGITFDVGETKTIEDKWRQDPIIDGLVALGDLTVVSFDTGLGTAVTQEELTTTASTKMDALTGATPGNVAVVDGTGTKVIDSGSPPSTGGGAFTVVTTEAEMQAAATAGDKSVLVKASGSPYVLTAVLVQPTESRWVFEPGVIVDAGLTYWYDVAGNKTQLIGFPKFIGDFPLSLADSGPLTGGWVEAEIDGAGSSPISTSTSVKESSIYIRYDSATSSIADFSTSRCYLRLMGTGAWKIAGVGNMVDVVFETLAGSARPTGLSPLWISGADNYMRLQGSPGGWSTAADETVVKVTGSRTVLTGRIGSTGNLGAAGYTPLSLSGGGHTVTGLEIDAGGSLVAAIDVVNGSRNIISGCQLTGPFAAPEIRIASAATNTVVIGNTMSVAPSDSGVTTIGKIAGEAVPFGTLNAIG